jgi:hypothetical protein
MEIENRIILQLDGSAVIKENIRIHKELLDFTDDSGKPLIMNYLEKSVCENRAKDFGTGAVLRSHSLKSLNGGVKLLEAEYTISDINNLNIINPFLSYTNYKDMGFAKFLIKPSYLTWNGHGFDNAGMMSISVITEKPGVGQKPISKGEPRLKSPTPVTLQKYRDLQPIFVELMKEFKISVVFESYAPIMTNYGLRDKPAQPRACEIFAFSGADYDNAGGMLLDNEEIMQELLRQKFWDYNLIRTVSDFPNNLTVPVISEAGSPYGNYGTGARTICFKPSKPLFQKYFEGQILDLGYPKNEKVPAEFEKIGYDPEKDTRKVTPKATTNPIEKSNADKPKVEIGK